MEEDSDAPEEFTNVESRDAVEETQKLESENKRRMDFALKAKRRKQNEANREAKQRKLEKEKENANGSEEEEPEMDALAKKNAGFLDSGIIQFLVEKDRKQNLEDSAPEVQTEQKAPTRKRKKRAVDYTVNDRTKLVILKETKPCTGEGVEFLKKRLIESHKRSLTMLRGNPPPRSRR